MSALSFKRIRRYFLFGAALGIVYLLVNRNQSFPLQLVDCLFVAGIFPLIIGCFLLAKSMGAFDLLAYTHITLKKYSKKAEKLEENDEEGTISEASEKADTYAEYISRKPYNTSFKEPFLVGFVYCFISILLILMLY